ncbi:hypothetical protein AMECASPLE_028049, partial [Ameca splendens]
MIPGGPCYLHEFVTPFNLTVKFRRLTANKEINSISPTVHFVCRDSYLGRDVDCVTNKGSWGQVAG